MQPRKKFKRVVPDEISVSDLTIDDIVCGTTKCNDGYHCYSQKKTSLRRFGEERVCKECGANLIDWERVHKHDLSDSHFVFQELKTEIIRHVFWHTPFEESALVQLHKRGRIKTREIALKLLKTRIGKYNNFMDGRQTPMGKEELVNYAQHATATCCRKCLEAWHNIAMESELTTQQLEFCIDLVMKYIDERIPLLDAEPLASDEEAKRKIYDHN